MTIAKRKTFEEVSEVFSQSGYLLLETEYLGQNQKMKCICPKHPEEPIYLTYKVVKRGGGCRKCGYEKLSEMYRHDFEYVKGKFSERGYELLETEYINSSIPMRYVCPNHPNVKTVISLKSLLNGCGCLLCSHDSIEKTLTYENILEDFRSRDYILLETEYLGYFKKHRYICKKHSDKELSITISDIRYGYGCRYCAIDRRKMELNSNWSDGNSSLVRILRGATRPWRNRIMKRYDRRCFFTQERNEIEVHHINSFYPIAKEALATFGYSEETKLGQLSISERNELTNYFIKIHDIVEGVPMKKDLHRLFHKIYGSTTNKEDFIDFCQRFERGEIEY